MRCNYNKRVFVTKEQVEKACEEDVQSRIDEMYDEIKKDIITQVMATCAFELEKEFDFNKEQLLQFISGVGSMFSLMIKGVLGVEMTPDDCIKHCKDKHDIEFDIV